MEVIARLALPRSQSKRAGRTASHMSSPWKGAGAAAAGNGVAGCAADARRSKGDGEALGPKPCRRRVRGPMDRQFASAARPGAEPVRDSGASAACPGPQLGVAKARNPFALFLKERFEAVSNLDRDGRIALMKNAACDWRKLSGAEQEPWRTRSAEEFAAKAAARAQAPVAKQGGRRKAVPTSAPAVSTATLAAPMPIAIRSPAQSHEPPRKMSRKDMKQHCLNQLETRLGDYEIACAPMIGKGSYGAVVRVHHIGTMRVCAAKVFIHNSCLVKDEVNVYHSLANSPHPVFLDLLAFHTGKPVSWMVTPWCCGGSLADYISGGKRLSGRVGVGCANQLRSGLHHLHTKAAWLHLDLKPGNILWNADKHEAHIIDFSLSEHWPVRDERLHSVHCTGAYRPPELMTSPIRRECIAPAVDAWSLGCTIFEAFAGRRLFLDAAMIQEFDVAKSKLVQNLPHFCRFVDGLLVRDPTSRRYLGQPFDVPTVAQAAGKGGGTSETAGPLV